MNASRPGPSRLGLPLFLFAGLGLATGCSSHARDQEGPAETAQSAQAAETGAPEVTPAPKKSFSLSRKDCAAVPVFAAGEAAGSVCADDAEKLGLTVLDLSDEWSPRVFARGPSGDAPEYRKKYLELARSSSTELGLNGVAPVMSVLTHRLTDEKRKACDAKVDTGKLAALAKDVAAAQDDKAKAALLKQVTNDKDAVTTIQSELVCAGLLKPALVSGRMTSATQSALEVFRRRHMIIGVGLDESTLAALALGGEELAFRGVLRGLREHVAEAAGLIEDGTALEKQEPVLGRSLDLTRFAPEHVEALPNGAPDLVDQATDKAARELGWTDPEAARAAIAAQSKDGAGVSALRVAVELPKAPSWHSAAMDLRVEIDRGDLNFGATKKDGPKRRPTFVVYAKDGDREVALIRWATTIGGWKKERLEDGEIALKYKESDVGDRVWRQVIAAPAWMPPDSTPETDLVREDKDGNLLLKRDLIQPGFANAYGLVMMIHEEAVERGGKTVWVDHGIRTHGSVDYRSIQRGTSHGCHRLYNQLALRLSGFVLDHRAHDRRGKMKTEYHRTLEHNGQSIDVDVPNRGFLYELDPPVPVKVLEGNITGAKPSKTSMIKLPSDGPKGA